MLGSREVTDQEAQCDASEAANVKTARPRKRKADVAIYLQDVDEDAAEMTKKKQRDCESSMLPSAMDTKWLPGQVVQRQYPSWDDGNIKGAAWRSKEGAYASPARGSSTLDGKDEREQQITLINAGFPHYNLTNVFATPVHCAPLPALCWASKDVVWNNMLAKDKTYTRNVNMMAKHPHLQPKMRAVLLDWLMEVSEVYKLHRETYHLAQDYFDRFMATQTNVFKSTLQLIGISCLFIAAKVEEMYPPKVHQFAYVTDEACTEDEILSMEVIIMKELKWSLSPQTPVSWLNVYMQVAYLKESDQLLIPKYPQATFTHIAELLDVCMLDMRCLEFSNGVLAASALFHFSSLELVENVSALKRAELEECVRWMVPFAVALRESGGSPMKTFSGVAAEDVHNIQTHAPYLTWLEKAASYQDADLEPHRGCQVPSGVLTPPLSIEKTDEHPKAATAALQVPPRMRAAEWTLAP